MVIQHNISALNALRQNNIVTRSKQKHMEKLSSGYKINWASDNAAGLSISEKMRKQVRGLTRAVENIEDGVSLCQVADGALTEVHEILQRMNELSIQSANGTNSQSDRSYIQDEVDALTTEIDRIAYTTSFNEHIYPLKGNTKVSSITNSLKRNVPIGGITVGGTRLELADYAQIREFAVTNKWQKDIVWDGITYHPGDVIRGNYLLYNSALDLRNDDFGLIGVSSGMRYSNATFLLPLLTDAADVDERMLMMLSTGSSSGGVSIDSWEVDSENNAIFVSTDGEKWIWGAEEFGRGRVSIPELANSSWPPEHPNSSWPWIKASIKTDIDTDIETNIKEDLISQQYINKSNVWIQMGAESGEGMNISLVDATVKGIGLEGINVLTEENAGKAIGRISKALHKVSKYRSTFGAQQNRLGHGILINENVVENTTAAESRIRDTDMAKEMVKFSIQNILAQIGQSMLAQANQSNQGVLSLLS